MKKLSNFSELGYNEVMSNEGAEDQFDQFDDFMQVSQLETVVAQLRGLADQLEEHAEDFDSIEILITPQATKPVFVVEKNPFALYVSHVQDILDLRIKMTKKLEGDNNE